MTSSYKCKGRVDGPPGGLRFTRQICSESFTFLPSNNSSFRSHLPRPAHLENSHSLAQRSTARREKRKRSVFSVSSEDLEEDEYHSRQKFKNSGFFSDEDDIQIISDDDDDRVQPIPRRPTVTATDLRGLHSSQTVAFDSADSGNESSRETLKTLHEKRNVNTLYAKLNYHSGHWMPIDMCPHNNTSIDIYDDLELLNGDFFRVQEIWQNRLTEAIHIVGRQFFWQSELAPLLDECCDTVYEHVEIPIESADDTGFVRITASQVKQKVHIILTNCAEGSNTAHVPGVFYCRWKFVKFFKTIGKERRTAEVELTRIRSKDCDEGYAVDDETIRYEWRGETHKGGSSHGLYTAVDGFCCSGGWTRGATQAGGFEVVRSFDMDENACQSYEMNFPNTQCLRIPVDKYCSRQDDSIVDIVHLSNPCKTWSAAHTRVGKNDDANSAASFCITEVLKKDKPRVVTLENTSGLFNRHTRERDAILAQFTSNGYSLRFAVLQMRDYGLAQSRERLIAIASW